jgi:hypothetical protein
MTRTPEAAAVEVGATSLIPVETLENLSVEQKKLVANQENSINGNTDEQYSVITADIDIKSMSGLGKVFKVEDGINDFVDELRKSENHLPNTITGVWVYYLTKGIEKDFGRTWNDTPKSLKRRLSHIEQKYKDGKRVMTKKQKNLLLQQTEYNFYRGDIKNGIITKEEALKLMNEAIEQVDKLESEGYYLPTKKTESVKLYDIEKEIIDGAKSDIGNEIYKKHLLQVIYPNILQKYDVDGKLKVNHQEDIYKSGFNEYELEEWRNPARIMPFKDYFSENNLLVNTIHIGRLKKRGTTSHRFVILDCRRKDTQERALILHNNTSTNLYF